MKEELHLIMAASASIQELSKIIQRAVNSGMSKLH
jgi:hypothetical protein